MCVIGLFKGSLHTPEGGLGGQNTVLLCWSGQNGQLPKIWPDIAFFYPISVAPLWGVCIVLCIFGSKKGTLRQHFPLFFRLKIRGIANSNLKVVAVCPSPNGYHS